MNDEEATHIIHSAIKSLAYYHLITKLITKPNNLQGKLRSLKLLKCKQYISHG